MDLKNKVMKLYEDILEPVKERKIVLLLKYVIVDGETDIRKIRTEIPIGEETLKKYVADDSLMLRYLTPDELRTFRMKMDKVLDVNQKLIRLIKKVMVENETDIEKLTKSIPINVETLKKYLNDKEKLSKYLTDEELKIFASRIESILSMTNTKLKRLIKSVLEDGETDLDVIEEKAYIKIATIKKHMENPTELKKYLTGEKLSLLLDKLDKMFKEKDKKLYNEELNLVRKIIDDIFNTRYTFNDVCSRNFLARERFEAYLDDENYMNKNFPNGTAKRVRAKIEENGLIREKKPRDTFILEDRLNIYYAKEDITFLNQFDNKRLNFAAYYLASGANLELVIKQFETNIQVALGILSDSKLEQILKPQHYDALEKCIKIEKLLIENNLIEKKQMIFTTIKYLEQNNFDKELAMAYFKIPEYLFNKILMESIKLPYSSNETKEELKKILYLDEDKKIK